MTDGARIAGRTPPIVGLILLFAALVAPVIGSGRGGTSEASDETRYHVPIIETMASQWPRVDVVNYRSATSPGYHLALAAARRGGAELPVLRSLNAAVSLLLLLAVFAFLAGRVGSGAAFVLSLPVLACTYFLSGAMWLTTDNAALLFVVLAVGGAALVPPTPGRLLACGVCAALAVSIRQVHLWTAAPIGFVALAAGPAAAWLPAPFARAGARPQGPAVTGAGVLGAALPFGVVAVLVAAWGGLTPPMYRGLHDAGLNPATLGFALALAGGLGLPLLTVVPWRLRARDPLLWGLVAVAIVATTAWPTDWNREAGRWGGALWRLVELGPDVAHRSLVLVPLAVLGAAVIAALLAAARHAGRAHEAVILVLALVGFVAAQAFNTQCFQRYLEVVLLVGLLWLAALGRGERPRRAWWIGPAALALGEAAVSLVNIYMAVW